MYRLTHWHVTHDDQGIAWVELASPERRVNVLGRAVLEELDRLLAAFEAEPPRGIVFHSRKPSGFAGGADIHELAALADTQQVLELVSRGQGIFDRLEGLESPTVIALHGACLGGALEMALACRYRVADDEPGTRLGLPEVRIGIHPGFGGTLRAPRLLGAPAAMDLMLTGRAVDGRHAARLGLVDACVPARQLHNAARALLDAAPPAHRPGLAARLGNRLPARPVLAHVLRRRLVRRVDPAHYPAPFALVELWRRHGGSPRRMLEAEGRSIAELHGHPSAGKLIRTFMLQERLKALGRERPDGEGPDGHAEARPPVARVHVVGAGAMGGDIAAWCALQGLTVSLQDTRGEALGRAVARARGLMQRRLKTPRRVQAALDRLIPDPAGHGAARADLVLEAIVEDLDAKRGLLADLEPRLAEHAVLATNTSSLPLERLAEALHRPERLVGLHFFNPVARLPLVEVVSGADSGEQALSQARAFTRAIDRLPLPVASNPGFLVNRVLMPYLLEALRLLEEGLPPAHVDRAATRFGMPMGPLHLADAVGLDVCLAVARVFAEHFGSEVPARLEALVAAGHLGKKSGRGLYPWQGEAPRVPPARGEPPPETADRLILPLVREALACLAEGVVADADLVDAGLIFGAGFAPFRGGPLTYLRERGAHAVGARLAHLAEHHGDRYAPPPDWETMAKRLPPDARAD